MKELDNILEQLFDQVYVIVEEGIRFEIWMIFYYNVRLLMLCDISFWDKLYIALQDWRARMKNNEEMRI